MSEFTDSEITEEPEARGLRKQIEEQAAKAREAEARATAAERKLAFVEAGIDLTDPKTSYFVKGYDGEADPTKIKEAALAAGFITPAEPEVSAAELAEHQKAAALAAGAQTTTFDQNAEYEAEMAAARSKDEIFAVMAKYGSERTSYV